MKVPAGAKVFVNGVPTRSVGAVRHYVSRGLTPGQSYTYNLQVEFVRDRERVRERRTIKLIGGDSRTVVFGRPPSIRREKRDRVASSAVETKLTLRVPAEAEVYLAGKQSQTSGPLRIYRTTKLAAGGAWEDYTIRVVLERDGRRVAQERTLTLRAGEQREIAFDFDTQPSTGSIAAAAR